MQFAEIRDLDMVPDLHLEFNDEGESGRDDGAVVNVYDNDDEHLLALFDENGLLDFTELESEILDENLDQFLISAVATLLESVECFAQTANVVREGWISIAWQLAHVDSFFVV